MRNTCGSINQKQNSIGLFHSNQYLLGNFFFKNVFTTVNKPSRINHIEGFAIPVADAVLSVARYAAYIVDNRLTLFQQAIKQCTLSYIWSADYCYCKTHRIKILNRITHYS